MSAKRNRSTRLEFRRYRSVFRLLITGFFIVVAALLIASALRSGHVSSNEIVAHLGTEAVGIAVTVGFVDYLLERSRHREAAKSIAWEALHQLDHAVWVWQGGSRKFDPGELLALIEMIGVDDPLPDFTQNLFLRLGGAAQAALRAREDILDKARSVKEAIEFLEPLCALRDRSEPMSPKDIQQKIAPAALALLDCVGYYGASTDVSLYREARDASEEKQRWRHLGEV